jgi:hypothetical protein
MQQRVLMLVVAVKGRGSCFLRRTHLCSLVTDVVNNVADAIHSTKVDEVHPNLYGAAMFMPGFTKETLIVAFSHLVDNKAQGTIFVGMSHSHHVLWLRTYVAKNYYM